MMTASPRSAISMQAPPSHGLPLCHTNSLAGPPTTGPPEAIKNAS
jgi:hypothetical protein